jgi:hypothetical protein
MARSSLVTTTTTTNATNTAKKRGKRSCSECGKNTTRIHHWNKNQLRYEQWYRKGEGKYICYSCYMKNYWKKRGEEEEEEHHNSERDISVW